MCETLGVEDHGRVPGRALTCVAPGQPIDDEPAVARRQRGIVAKWLCRIAAEPAIAAARGPHRLQNAELGRRQEETRSPDPMLAHVLENPDRLVVAVDVPQADRPPFDGLKYRGREAFKVSHVELPEGAGGHIHEIVRPQTMTEEPDGGVDRGEFPSLVVAPEQCAPACLLHDAWCQRGIDDHHVSLGSGKLRVEKLVEFALRRRVFIRSITSEDRQDTHVFNSSSPTFSMRQACVRGAVQLPWSCRKAPATPARFHPAVARPPWPHAVSEDAADGPRSSAARRDLPAHSCV